jgi:lysozyme family protein
MSDTLARSIQADLNYFAEKVGFPNVKVDGKLGPQTVEAFRAVYTAVVKANAMLAPTMVPPGTAEDLAKHGEMARGWLEGTARDALGLADLRRFHFGEGKDWNVKGAIAYGAGGAHTEFEALQRDLNTLADAVNLEPLEVDGFIGKHTAAFVSKVYDAVVAKNPVFAATPFPVPDTKELTAEYAMFIRSWLEVAGKVLAPTVA